MNLAPLAVAYGGGTNSTAMLAGMLERGLRPDLILFANTGCEKPHTYEHVGIVNDWCARVGFPAIVTTVKGGRVETLEENCHRMNMLPSIAYGFKGCSHKFKREPQDRDVNRWPPAQLAWEAGLKVQKFIGYDADEERRAKIKNDAKYNYHYPLIEWGWGREECVAAIQRAGLPQPGKSACFFCPSSTRQEIDDLKREYPLLFQRALAMERNAEPNLDTVAGLGRRFSWHEHAEDYDHPDSHARAFVDRANARYAAGRAAARPPNRSPALTPPVIVMTEIDYGTARISRLAQAFHIGARSAAHTLRSLGRCASMVIREHGLRGARAECAR